MYLTKQVYKESLISFPNQTSKCSVTHVHLPYNINKISLCYVRMVNITTFRTLTIMQINYFLTETLCVCKMFCPKRISATLCSFEGQLIKILIWRLSNRIRLAFHSQRSEGWTVAGFGHKRYRSPINYTIPRNTPLIGRGPFKQQLSYFLRTITLHGGVHRCALRGPNSLCTAMALKAEEKT
jgi:hypothetical protein